MNDLGGILRRAGGREAARVFSGEVTGTVVAACDIMPARVCVLALGGLARRQLLPHADVDIGFVVDGSLADFAAVDFGAVVSRLWDKGLRVSWSVRARAELPALFDEPVGKSGHAATALLEARPIAGDIDAGRALLRELRSGVGARRRQGLFEARVDEALLRRARFHNSPSLVEPDLKEGPGGLRDVQLLGWAGLCKSGVDVGDDDVFEVLLRAGSLFPSELEVIGRGLGELLTLRAGLVLGTSRPERLHADAAEKAAAVLDEAGDGLRPGEAVVRRAVIAMREILVVVDDALARFAPTRAPRRRMSSPGDTLSGLLTTHEPVFPGAFTGLLERGTLQPLLPDLARLTGRVKHDGIHAFTTDAHLARCADIAAAIVAGAGVEILGDSALPPSLAPILMRCSRAAVVVASALLHDIGKGLPGDHSVVGEEIARKTLTAASFSNDDVEDVCFLVRHHLELSTTAQRRDLGDPAVIDAIAGLVGTPERLDALALLTWCDWCAVGPGVGTLWKAQLLRSCVDGVREALLSPQTRARALEDVKAHAREAVGAAGDEFVDGASAGWLRGRFPDELRADVAAFNSGHCAVVDDAPPQRAWVRCRDRAGLLADLAAAFASEGASVLDARLDVRTDGDAFDAFAFDDGRGQPLPKETAQRVAVALDDAVAGRRRPVSRTRPTAVVPPRVRFIEEARAGLGARVVVEVRGADRRGLLYDLARAFADLGLSITVARLHTEGARVTDVFTAHREDGNAVDDELKVALTRALLRVLEN